VSATPYQPCSAHNWQRTETKFLYDILLGKMLQPELKTVSDREVPYLRAANVQWATVDIENLSTMYASVKEIETFQVEKGDLLVCEGGEVGRAAILDKEVPPDTIIQNALHRVRGKGEHDVRFLGYLLRHIADHDWFSVLCNKATIAHFTGEKFGDLLIWHPTPNVQEQIADFLDHETARIDSLIVAKENHLALIAEKRRALINTAVTRGINPTVRLKDSGIPWLGPVPEHWEIERSKWLFKERDIRSEFGDEEMLTVSHITGVTSRAEKNVNMFMAESQEGSKICEAGDLVINTLWAWMGAMGVSPQRGIVSPAYNVYEPGDRLDKAYLDYLVRMPVFAQEAIRYSKGVWSSRLRLYPEGLYEIWFPVPPVAEQQVIAEYLKIETAKLDALKAATELTITLLRERRSALIAAAVTGKIGGAF
jgi:type I restriction enzyme S subunit